MVQTVFYHSDNTSKTDGYKDNSKIYLSQRVHLQNYASNNMYIEPGKVKSIKNHCIKLQPLNAKTENNVLGSAEGKFSHKLNSPHEASVKSSQRRPSKIPVLQRKILNGSKLKNGNGQCDKTLSAADRRQKFHQSRVRIFAAEANPDKHSVISKQKVDVYPDLLPWYNGYILQQVNNPSVPTVSQKSILPPIKPVDVTQVAGQKHSQPKNKCLLGEITHFPALCNPSCLKRQKKSYISSVPHLPPILPPPAAPPPSISTSVEQEGNQLMKKAKSAFETGSAVKEQVKNNKRNDVWSPKYTVSNKLIAV